MHTDGRSSGIYYVAELGGCRLQFSVGDAFTGVLYFYRVGGLVSDLEITDDRLNDYFRIKEDKYQIQQRQIRGKREETKKMERRVRTNELIDVVMEALQS